jgi:Trk K+ transport system NAD-binding subunit
MFLMRVVVVGCGRVGSELATILSREGNEVAVIDKNPRALQRLAMDWGGKGVTGFGFDRDALEEAGIDGADAWLRLRTATTPTSLRPGSPKRPIRSPTWWPAFTIPVGL